MENQIESQDAELDGLISFKEVSEADWFWKKGSGHRIPVKTIRGWATKGTRGFALETTMVGGRIYTTKRWCLDFMQALDNKTPRPKGAVISPAKKQREFERGCRELQAAGLM